MANLSLNKAKNAKLRLRTAAQEIADPELKKLLLEQIEEAFGPKWEISADEVANLEKGVADAKSNPGKVVAETARPATPEEVEAAKKNLTSGGASPKPEPPSKTPAPKKTSGKMVYTYQPDTPGEYAYFKGTKDVGAGKVESVSIIIHGKTREEMLANAKKYMAEKGIQFGKEVSPGVYENVYVQTIPNPTTGNSGPIDAKSAANSFEANYAVKRKEAFKRVDAARKRGAPLEEIQKLQAEVPPDLLTTTEQQTYEASREANKEARKNKKGKLEQKDFAPLGDDQGTIRKSKGLEEAKSYITKAGGTPINSTVLDKDGQKVVSVTGYQMPDGSRIEMNQVEKLGHRLAISEEEMPTLAEGERAAIKKLRNQLGNGNFSEALVTADAIPAGSVEKVMRSGKPSAEASAPNRPQVLKERWVDPPELEAQFKAAKATSIAAKRELRVRHLFESGAFNVMGDDRSNWITENPEGWAKMKANPNAMHYLETVGKNRGIAMTKVVADRFEAGVLKPLNVAIGRMSEPGADVTKNIVTLGETTGKAFFTNGELKKNITRMEKEVGQAAAKERTFSRSDVSQRRAEIEKYGWTEESLQKKIEGYNTTLSKMREKASAKGQRVDAQEEETLLRRIRQAESDKAMLVEDRELRAKQLEAVAKGEKAPLRTYRETKRTGEEQLATVETQITRLEQGFHPSENYGPGINAGKPVRVGRTDKNGVVKLSEGWQQRLNSLKSARDRIKARGAASKAIMAGESPVAPTTPPAEAAAPAAGEAAAAAAKTGAPAAEKAVATAATAAGLPNPFKKAGKWKPNPARDAKMLAERAKAMGKAGGLVGKGASALRFLGPLVALWGGYETLKMLHEGTVGAADEERLKTLEALNQISGGMGEDIQNKQAMLGMQRMVDMAAMQRQQQMDSRRQQFVDDEALNALLAGHQANLSVLAQPSRPSIAEMMARM